MICCSAQVTQIHIFTLQVLVSKDIINNYLGTHFLKGIYNHFCKLSFLLSFRVEEYAKWHDIKKKNMKEAESCRGVMVFCVKCQIKKIYNIITTQDRNLWQWQVSSKVRRNVVLEHQIGDQIKWNPMQVFKSAPLWTQSPYNLPQWRINICDKSCTWKC